MAEAGILRHGERVELLSGVIVRMSPIGSRHAAWVDALANLLIDRIERRAMIRVQNPVRLDSNSEPEPDVTVIRRRGDFYASAHPGPDDVLLLIEVSDTTVAFDREVKLPLYAAAGNPRGVDRRPAVGCGRSLYGAIGRNVLPVADCLGRRDADTRSVR